MTCSQFALNSYKTREKSNFKGTLLGIVVSFFILILFSFLLNLAESYLSIKKNSLKNSQSQTEAPEHSISWHRLFGIKEALAYTKSDYKAQILISSSENLILSPGEEVIYRIGFKNIGKAIWKNSGNEFISIYTYNPKYRKSLFQGSGWYRALQPAKLSQPQVNPGGIGFIEFRLKAPSVPGEYKESFHLAAEDRAWIDGGLFTIPILVSSNKPAQIALKAPPNATLPQIQTQEPKTISNSNFGGIILLKSHDKIEAKAGEVVDVRVMVKNTGKEKWESQAVLASEELLEDGKSIFYYPTWTSGHQPASNGRSVSPGQTSTLEFKVQTPEVKGEYEAKFKIVANYNKDVGADFEIPVYVTNSSDDPNQSGRVSAAISMQEPEIQIGLYYLTSSAEAVEFTADKDYQIKDKSGAMLANLSANESARVQYDFNSKVFSMQNARFNFTASGELHFEPKEPNAIFTILSMSRNGAYGYNYNKYRDGIILRQAESTGRLWVINKLPMEHYLWGIAETSNLSDIDYIKAILVASRTYALYHFERNTKWGGYFHLHTSTADQLYQGYVSEAQRSRVVQAVNETRGQVITYDGDVVITPYFGHSDGRTRSWTEVWGGSDKSWLRSVSVPSDSGRTLWGHGVGMSAKGAYHNAETDGWDYMRILRYYYTGVEISRVY